jgi:hypothetical protein
MRSYREVARRLRATATAPHDSETVRSPFGELHAQAVSNCPPTPDNWQRTNLLDGKPNVWQTLYRHMQALAAVTSDEQYDAVVAATCAGMRSLKPRSAVLSVSEAHEQEEAAEGMQDVAQVAADRPDATLGDWGRAAAQTRSLIVAAERYYHALTNKIRSYRAA